MLVISATIPIMKTPDEIEKCSCCGGHPQLRRGCTICGGTGSMRVDNPRNIIKPLDEEDNSYHQYKRGRKIQRVE